MSADVIVEAGDVNITGRWPIPRDVMLQEDWPEVEGTQGVPAQLRFQHYLGLLSAVRVLQPVKLVFHYTELPVANDYNDWFEDNLPLWFAFANTSSDLTRGVIYSARGIALLYKYGGVYQDNDVYWVQPVPDNLFTYPFVASLDWPKRGEWPETINNGVLMAQRRSHYIHLNLATFVNYVDHVFGRFSLKGTYRSYELHPDTMLMDNRLQVICHATKCHPAWKRQIQQENFNWREIFSVHVTLPKPAPAFVDLNTLRNSTGMYAEIGRHILQKSGRSHLLE
nr:hypothetical protein BaRGS_028394 [Batillaria attramentaria]